MATHGTAEAVPFWGLVVLSFVGIAAKNARFGRFFGFCGLRKIKQSISAAAGIFLFLGGFFFFWGALPIAEQPLPVDQPKPILPPPHRRRRYYTPEHTPEWL